MRKIVHRFFRWIGKREKANRKFSSRLIIAFIFITVLPLISIQIMSYYIITATMRENISDFIDLNLKQTRKSLDVMLAGYSDLLYQIYTDDAAVENAKNIGSGHETAVNVNQLRRKLAGYCDAKPMIRCITIIAGNGQVITYDKLSPYTLESSWLVAYTGEHPGLYETIQNSKDAYIFSSGQATMFGGEEYHLFHMAYRMVDVLNIYNDAGVVIISLDAGLLNETCNDTGDTERISVNFLTDGDKIISYPDQQYIGAATGGDYTGLIENSSVLSGKHIAVSMLYDDMTGWTIINAADQTALYSGITFWQRIIAAGITLIGLVLIGAILLTSKGLTKSIDKVVKAIISAGEGELDVRIEPDDKMPLEVRTIAVRFNRMITEITGLIDNVKSATEKQKEAEIRALEAQINPHFIYNTLDTINWVAIDHDQYEISNMISSLAKILRYAVDKSNAVVRISQEIEWLRLYVFLQQARLKNSFECRMDIDSSVMDCRMHKLLIQPFIENAIIHGFGETCEKSVLDISIKDMGELLKITIRDNGTGMPDDLIELINNGGCRR